jgi:hypothetical protein
VGLLTVWAAVLPAPAQATSGEEGLRVMSDEDYVRTFGEQRARTEGVPLPAERIGQPAVEQPAGERSSHWSVFKFSAEDSDGRTIPTREGNREFGWKHFSGPHNITSSKPVKTLLGGHPERKQGHKLTYGGVLVDRFDQVIRRMEVIVQYHWKTKDGRFKLADHSHKIGVITAYCKGVNRCPDAVNR